MGLASDRRLTSLVGDDQKLDFARIVLALFLSVLTDPDSLRVLPMCNLYSQTKSQCSAPRKLDRFGLEFSANLSWLEEERKRMKASKFTDAQKAFIIKQGEEGSPVAEICRKAGISQATYFNWKKKYAGLFPSEMKRLKQLEDENGRLKKIVADLTLDREMLQDVIRRKV